MTKDPLAGLLDDPTLDSIYERDPGELSDDDLLRLVGHHRTERVLWEEKQKEKGKVE